MGIISSTRNIIGRYAVPHERVVGKFFGGLTEHSAGPSTRTKLGELLQQNIAAINLWTEYKYKGYTYLTRRKRAQLYTNLQIIAVDFDEFHNTQASDIYAPLQILQSLTRYFSAERYEYRASSSFGRLLVNPQHEKMVGDCNQIVTLYIYLYSQYADVRDLKVRLLPGHVALHYNGQDIEATNGTFVHYENQQCASLMPIEEIVSVNLLDTTDSYLKTHAVDPADFLQAARFAFILSHDRQIVTRNLDAAYAGLINGFMDKHNYKRALAFAKQSKDMELLAIVGHNGAVHYMGEHDFAVARKYAEFSPKRTELIKTIYRNEGAYHYNAHRYHDAITAFTKAGVHDWVQKSYEGLFFAMQDNLPKKLTSETIKSHAHTIKRMAEYAKKSGNKNLIVHVDNLKKHL